MTALPSQSTPGDTPVSPGDTISVVMPCYNAAATLPRALASVAAQTLPPCELICVDDGSRDASVACLEAFARDAPFPLVIVRQPQNGGVAKARNAGISAARGRWIAFLDSDDAWHPGKLAAQLELALRCGADLVGGYSAVTPAGSAAANAGWPELGILSAEPVSLLGALLRNPYHMSTVLVKVRPTLRFVEGRLGDDYALSLNLLRDGAHAVRHNAGLARMFKAPFGEAGLSRRHWAMESGELASLLDACRGRPWLVPPVVVFSLAKYLLRLIRSAARRVGPAP